ncbi:MAG TPA: nitrous oxide-stimulated promoter family protein [Candidatus Bathyarchaeia archaeon]
MQWSIFYCHNHHTKGVELCVECTNFMVYAKMRLDNVPFRRKRAPVENA